MEFRRLAALTASLFAVAAPPAAAQLPVNGPPPGAYRAGDAGGLLNALPPGENGFDNALDLAQFEANGARPANAEDQLPLYRDLLTGYRTLDKAHLGTYFKDASFGVKPVDVKRTYSPRADVTIVRDGYGVPHIYGSTRGGAAVGIRFATPGGRLLFPAG